MRRALLAAVTVAAAAVAACRHGAAPEAPPGDARLWARAEVLAGTGRHHLPLPAVALVATGGARGLAIVDGGGVVEVDLARGEAGRARLGAIDGVVRDAALVGGRVLAVGAGPGGERAWWIDPAKLAVTPVALAAGADAGGLASAGGVAATRDGRLVVITGRRLPLAMRDARTLAPAELLSAETGWTEPAVVGNTYVFASRRGELAVFDLDDGEERTGRMPVDVAFVSGDGLFAYAGPPDPPRLSDVYLGHPVPLPAPPRGVAWSPDGVHAIVVAAARVDLLAYPSGDVHPVDAPPAGARALFSRDGAHAIVTARGALWRVDPITGRAIAPPGPLRGEVTFAAPADGGVLAAADEWRAMSARGTTARGAWPGGGGARVVVSPGGARLAAAAPDGAQVVIGVFDARTGARVQVAAVDDVVDALDVADDGTVVAATPRAITRLAPDGRIEPLGPVHAGEVLAVDAAAGRVVLARGGALAVTGLDARRAVATLGAPGCDDDARAWLAPDGRRLAVAAGAEVAIWDATRGARLAAARLPGRVRALAFAGDTIVASTDDRLILWDPAAGAVAALATPAPVTAIGADPRGDRVALGFGDGRAGVWRAADLRALARPTALAAGAPARPCPGDPLAAAP